MGRYCATRRAGTSAPPAGAAPGGNPISNVTWADVDGYFVVSWDSTESVQVDVRTYDVASPSEPLMNTTVTQGPGECQAGGSDPGYTGHTYFATVQAVGYDLVASPEVLWPE